MAFKNPLGKYRPKKPVYTTNPTGRAASPARPGRPGPGAAAGGQGTVVQPPMGPDESYKDSIYNQTKSNISTGLQNLQGYLTNAGIGLGKEYGIDFEYEPTKDDPATPQDESNPFALKQIGTNPDGSPKYFDINENVDVKNPFSRAALLKRAHTQNVRGNTNSYAARGQLYSGALQNAQNSEQFAFQGGQDQLLKDFAGRYGDTYRKWQEAQTAAGKEDLDAIAAAQERHRNDPAVGAGFNTGGAAAEGTNPNQYADSAVAGVQPRERTDPAVKAYLEKQRKTKAGKSKKPRYSGGAKAPGGKRG